MDCKVDKDVSQLRPSQLNPTVKLRQTQRKDTYTTSILPVHVLHAYYLGHFEQRWQVQYWHYKE